MVNFTKINNFIVIIAYYIIERQDKNEYKCYIKRILLYFIIIKTFETASFIISNLKIKLEFFITKNDYAYKSNIMLSRNLSKFMGILI